MPTFPASLLPWIDRQFHDLHGAPLAFGRVYSFVVGTATPKDTYVDAQRTAVNTNPIVLDSEGRATVFIGPGGYDFAVHDALDALLYTVEAVEDIGLEFLSNIGVLQLTGPGVQVSGYVVQITDRFLPVNSNSTNPTLIYLPPANTYFSILVIQNRGGNPIDVTPDNLDTINLANAPFTIPAAAVSSGRLPALQLASDGVSDWTIIGAFLVP